MWGWTVPPPVQIYLYIKCKKWCLGVFLAILRGLRCLVRCMKGRIIKKPCRRTLGYISWKMAYRGAYQKAYNVLPVCSRALPPRYYSKRGGLSPVYTFIKQLPKMASWCLFGYIAWFRVSCETYGVRPPTWLRWTRKGCQGVDCPPVPL